MFRKHGGNDDGEKVVATVAPCMVCHGVGTVRGRWGHSTRCYACSETYICQYCNREDSNSDVAIAHTKDCALRPVNPYTEAARRNKEKGLV